MKSLWPKDNAQNLSILILMLLTLFTYFQLVLHPFFWIDDLTYISRNLMVKHGFNKESLVWAFSTLFYGNWCPITWIVHMLDVELFGLWAGGHHLSSLFLHLLNTLLIFMFLYKATSSFGKAFGVALLFALHPLHVEAVAWASSKKDLLSGFFGGLFLLSYLRYVTKSSKQSYLLCVFLYLLGLASKSSLIPFAFILLVLDYWPLERISFEELSNFKRRFWALLVEKIPFFILSVIFALLTFSAQKLAGAHDLMPQLSVGERLGNACFFVFSYILKTLWPFHTLGFPYPYYNFDPLALGLFALLLILILLNVLHFGAKYPWLFTGFFFFLLGLFPYLQLQQTGHQQMADRWMYLPVLGLFIVLVWSFGSILEKHVKLLHLKWATFLFAGVLAVSCFTQVSYWKTPESLLRHTISLSSGNHMAYVYLSSGLEMENRVKEALEEAKKGWSIAPTFKTFERIIGSLSRVGQAAESIHYLRNTEYEDPVFTLLEKAQIYSIVASYPDSREAYRKLFGSDPFEVCIETSKAGLELDKENPSFQTLIAAALMKLNKDSEAETIFRSVLEVQPKRSENHANIAALYFKTGKFKQALEHLEYAVKLNPNNRKGRINLSALYLNLGKIAQALREAEIALEITDQEADAFLVLANALLASGKNEEAQNAYYKALALSPRDSSALNGLATLLYKKKNYEEAVRLLKKSTEINADAAIAHFNLAMSLLALNRKEEAKKSFEACIARDPSMKAEIEVLLRKNSL